MAEEHSKQLEEMLEKEISRAEFIKYVGIALLSMLGVNTFLRSLRKSLGSSDKDTRLFKGYGGGPYGR